MKIDNLKIYFKQLGEMRDGFLILGSIIYLFGYLTWFIFSSLKNFGPVPALDLQYFVTGIPSLLVIIIAIFIIKYAKKFYISLWPRWYQRRKEKTKYLISILLAILLCIIIIFIIYLIDPPNYINSMGVIYIFWANNQMELTQKAKYETE